MTTVRRLFLYLASFIGMIVGLTGTFVLIGLLVDQGFDAFRGFAVGSSASAIALLIAGGVAWRFYWGAAQREAAATLEERASGTRKLYLYSTMTLSLIGALVLAQAVLTELLVRLLDTGLQGYKPWTSILIAAILAYVWYWHKGIAGAEQASGADGTRGADLRRSYSFGLAAFGIFTAAGGLIAFLSGVLVLLGGQGGSFVRLVPSLVQIVVWAVPIYLFWLPSQKAAAAGDGVERSSRTRFTLIHVVLFSALIASLNGMIAILRDILSRLLMGPRDDLLVLTLSDPLASLIVGGLLIFYFFRFVRPTLTTPRLAEYLSLGTAFAFLVIVAQQLIASVFQTLAGFGPPIEQWIVSFAPPLLAAGGVWWWRRRWIETDLSGADSAAARSSLWRKVYLYFYHLVGLVMILFGTVGILQPVIAAIFGQPMGNALATLADPLAFLLVGLGLLVYLMQQVTSDARLGALSAEQVMQHTLGDNVPTWAIAAAILAALTPILLLFGASFSFLASQILGGGF